MALIVVEDLTRPMEMDNKFSLDIWYRMGDTILKEAKVFRDENKYADLYIFLVRYISLVHETIPHHEDYRSPKYEKHRALANKRALAAFRECEALKPKAMKMIDRHNALQTAQPPASTTAAAPGDSGDPFRGSPEIPTWFGHTYDPSPLPPVPSGPTDLITGGVPLAHYAIPPPVLSEQQFALSTNTTRPSAETLGRHSFFSTPTFSAGRRSSSPSSNKVQYYNPSNIDSSPLPALSIDEWLRAPPPALPSSTSPQQEEVWPASNAAYPAPPPSDALTTISTIHKPDVNAPALVSLPEIHIPSPLYRQPVPGPMPAQVESLSTGSLGTGGLAPFAHQIRPENVADPRPGPAAAASSALSNDVIHFSTGPKKLHISTKLMKEFLRVASGNTRRNLETCGILAGLLKKGVFYVTTLIIPKQESTSDSCNTIDEETIFHVQDQRGLFQLGWIHTHPSQSCFMSSVDLHTHYSYQVMLPEAIAIVMAPTDPSRSHGIFRLSDPGGLKVLKNCSKKGFHPHEAPQGGGNLYEHSSHVFLNGNLQFDIVDLR